LASRGGVWWRGLGSSPEKKTFCPQSDKFGCIFPQFLTGRKHGSLNLGHGFYSSIAKLQSLQNSAKFTVRPKGAGRSHHRPLNTPLISAEFGAELKSHADCYHGERCQVMVSSTGQGRLRRATARRLSTYKAFSVRPTT